MDKVRHQPGTELEPRTAALIRKVVLDKRLNMQAKGLYSFFILHGYETQFDMNYIAANMGISVDTLRKYRDYLEAYGYITIKKERQESAKFSGNVYKIELEPKDRPELVEKIEAKNRGEKIK